MSRREAAKVADVAEAEDGKLSEARRFLDQLDALLGPVGGQKQVGKRVAAGAESKDATAERGTQARGSPGQRRRPAPAGQRVARRVRKWGEAARKAAQSEIADGPQGLPRSLRAVREAFPLSQQELADRTRLSRSTIAALEAGGRRAHPSTRRVIARVLKVEPGEIAWG